MSFIDINIAENINQFIDGKGKNKGRRPDERYASFDYCYNYFQSFRENNSILEINNDENIQLSCLQLGFYLASWGMLRGSTFLLEKSVKFYEPTITLITNYDKNIWSIDLDKYNKENIEMLLDFKMQLKNTLYIKRNVTDTLITKIMLGVFANIPAFDDFFCVGFGMRAFDRKSLIVLSDYYKKNKLEIDNIKIPTCDYLTGHDSSRLYTKAKILDMIGFIQGRNIRELENM